MGLRGSKQAQVCAVCVFVCSLCLCVSAALSAGKPAAQAKASEIARAQDRHVARTPSPTHAFAVRTLCNSAYAHARVRTPQEEENTANLDVNDNRDAAKLLADRTAWRKLEYIGVLHVRLACVSLLRDWQACSAHAVCVCVCV